ncbi:hypothetical protein QJQ45_012579 [Haematococcus lacustris]|nr:hypothetical protein QJQ45_012579 [Haematococcus lacustris]
MACGYGIDTKSSELQAGNLDKGHVADLMKEVDKHRRLLGMKKQGSLRDTLPLPCRMRHAGACVPLSRAEDMAEVSMEHHGRAKQLVVFFGAAGIGTAGGWGADAVLRACCKVVCRPRGTDQRRGRMVLVDEHRTTRPGASSVTCQREAAPQPAASEPGPSTRPPAKRSKRTETEQAAEPTQPTKAEQATELSKGKAAKAKPTP